MFKAWGRLPDEIGKQRPRNLFRLLGELAEEENDVSADIDQVAPEVRALYGR